MLAEFWFSPALELLPSLDSRLWVDTELGSVDKAKMVVVKGERTKREQDMPVDRKQG